MNRIAHFARSHSLAYLCMVLLLRTHNPNNFLSNLSFEKGVNSHKMNITITAPPAITGDTQRDTKNLNDWCRGFYIQLKRIMYSLDTSNIVELDASRLNGTLPLGETTLQGVNVKITGDEFSISTPDGSQYLTLSGGVLKFCGTVV